MQIEFASSHGIGGNYDNLSGADILLQVQAAVAN
jgi:hypothetical protein